MGEADELAQVVAEAQEMLGLGRVEIAERMLRAVTPLADRFPEEPMAITVHMLLASCAQRDERWGEAFHRYGQARDMAAAAGMIELAVAATNGLTGILVATGRGTDAVELSAEIVEMARPSGAGLGVALFGAGNVLTAVGDDRAADRYVEALAQPDMEDLRGPVLMRLGSELHRQHRTGEAVARYYEAVDAYQAAGHPYEAYYALRELSELVGSERTKAFVMAHAIVVEEFSAADTAHYEGFRERVRQIEADMRSHVDDARIHEVRNVVGERLKEGMTFLREHRLADADVRFRTAEELLSSINAYHELPRIWFVQGQLESRRGDYQRCAELLDRSAALNGQLGNASGELAALVYRCAHADRTDFEQLERLVRARALLPLATDHLAGTSAPMINNLFHHVCDEYGAHELAAEYGRAALQAAETHDPKFMRDLALQDLARDPARAAELRAELARMRNEATGPVERYVASRAMGMRRFEDGEFDDETLADLRDACAAHEEIRRSKGETDHSTAYTKAGLPPYAELAEVALRLGRAAEAFDALERVKSRTVLDALRVTAPDDEDPEEAALWQELLALMRSGDLSARADQLRSELHTRWEASPRLRAHRLAEPVTAGELPAVLGDAVLVELFVAQHGVYGFVADDGKLTVSTLDIDVAAVDPNAEPAEVLAHQSFLTLAGWLDQVAGGRPLYVVPHARLHRLPLHLTAQLRPRPGTHLLPSASILRYATPSWRPGAVVVGADPLGDLPFARVEGEHVAATHGVPVARHTEVTADWLAHNLATTSTPVVHLACHATFNERRPERSGLLLAHPDGGGDLVGPDRLATMDWSGAVVVLGACASGAHRVEPGDELAGLGRALLAAGAAATVVAWRPVGDFTSALLLTWLHDELAATTGPVRLGTALAAAQERMRTMSARDLISWAAGHRSPLAANAIAYAHAQAGNFDGLSAWRERQHLDLSEVDNPAYDVCPFAAPDAWGWFFVLGA